MVGVAAIGGAVISAGASVYSSNKASKDAKKARKAASSDAQAQLNFEKQQYAEQTAEWEETFGSVRDNLSDYFDNISPDVRAAQGIQNFEQERERAMTQIEESFAQRGISGSGVAAATELSNQLTGAERRAEISMEAEDSVRQEEMQFLQMGLASKPGNEGVSQAMSQQASQSAQFARDQHTSASKASAAAAGAVGDVAGAVVDWGVDKFG